jgi:hypothetical protein
MKVEPVSVDKVERWRYLGEEWDTLDNTPQKFKSVTLGCMEARIDGTWRQLKGSYMSINGPMVWAGVTSAS